MHDIGRSGADLCFYFIPIAGPIVLLVFLLTASAPANQYGEGPEALPETKKGGAFINGLLALPSYLHQTRKFGIFSWAYLILSCWFILSIFTPSYFYDKYTKESTNFVKANKKYRRGSIGINDYDFFQCWINNAPAAFAEIENIDAGILQARSRGAAKLNANECENEEAKKELELVQAYLEAATEMAEKLVDRGADPAHIADLSFKHGLMNANMMEILLDAKLDATEYLDDSIYYGDEKVLSALIEGGADLSQHDIVNLTVRVGNINLLKVLLENGATVNSNDVTTAINHDKELEMVVLLLEQGVQATHEHLCAAVNKNNTLIASELLKRGAEMKNILYKVVHSYGDNSILQFLIDNGADVNLDNPLHQALAYSNDAAIATLIKAEADVNKLNTPDQNNFADTPLQIAIERDAKTNNTQYVEALLKSGKTDVNLADSYGETPVLTAINSPEILKLLIQHGAEVDICCEAVNNWYRKVNTFNSPEYSLLFNADLHSALIILQGNIDPNRVFENGETYLSYAIKNNLQIELILALVKKGAVVDMEHVSMAFQSNTHNYSIRYLCDHCTNFNALRALSYCLANENRYNELVGHVLSKAEDLTEVDAEGNPLLIQCIKRKTSEECFNQILEHPGININQQDANGNTVLHFLAHAGAEKQLVRVLSMPGIDTTIKNNSGTTAYQLANNSCKPLFKQEYAAELKAKAKIEKAQQQAAEKQRKLAQLAAAEEKKFIQLLEDAKGECEVATYAIPYGRSEAAKKKRNAHPTG